MASSSNPLTFLVLVKGIITILFGIERQILSYNASAALCLELSTVPLIWSHGIS